MIQLESLESKYTIENVPIHTKCSAFDVVSRLEWVRSFSLTKDQGLLLYSTVDRMWLRHYFQASCIKQEAWIEIMGKDDKGKPRLTARQLVIVLNQLAKMGILSVDQERVIKGKKVSNRLVVYLTPSLQWLQARNNVLYGREIGRRKQKKVNKRAEIQKTLADSFEVSDAKARARAKVTTTLNPRVLAQKIDRNIKSELYAPVGEES